MATKAPQKPDSRPLAVRIGVGQLAKPPSLEFLLIGSAAILLTAFGVVMAFSATTVESLKNSGSPYAGGITHLIYAAVGVPLMLVMSLLSLRWLQRLAWPALILGIGLQLIVFTPLGDAQGGNRNWFYIGGMSIQPSEFLKAGLVLWLAYILFRKQALIDRFWHFAIPALPVAGLAMATVLAGEDLGTVMIMALVAFGTMYFAGVKLRFLGPIVIAGATLVTVFVVTSQNRMDRLLAVFDPNCDPSGQCYQPYHGLWGLAGGGIFGRGLGNSHEKYNWLPAAADDYIFAIVGEELGLVGCLVLFALFVVLGVGIVRILRRSDSMFVRALAGGIGVWILGQALVNIGVVLRLFPTLGVPLPYLSSGGSSLIAVLIVTGVLLALTRTLPETERAERRAQTPGK
ncbi:cell division protein FtsW [Microbacterium nanhaiense]|uniref:Probable peptidoglycan glycosyltransferase FtsW n=1 Tax=Microbacterium nanhaiense TaxID=1301026 RepID=A0ABQ2MY32_9MICO|nr:putative peptidoglycan glycosyltransferase FtsW [Microbacterium nanhaiense]GGO60696.1 cell division protein FtsW [Microbacterium nanhaiense]